MNAEAEMIEETDEDSYTIAAQDIREHTLLKLKNGLFALPVQTVREFLEVQDFIDVPESPPHVLGLITIRDENIAVVDLAMKLGMAATEHTPDTRIVVLEIPNEEGFSVIGAMVDSVVDVCVLEEIDKKGIPDFGGDLKLDYIQKLARYDEKTVIVLDVGKIFTDRLFNGE